MDGFHEQFLESKKPAIYTVAVALHYFTLGLGLLSMLLGQIALAILAFLIAIAMYFVKRNAYIEYEYELTMSEFDISVIYDKQRRKAFASFDVKDIEIMAPENSHEVLAHKDAKVKKCYTSAYEDANKYAVITTKNGKKVKYLIVPDEEMIRICFAMNPRKVRK
ncbi:DUF6106 family protein [Clostridium cellulovorans]|uniref:Uncharacterized protein n=1 Tax=Clostridium cellulovorans (strain ATCC 35296 / DSM 3052 / OCM 3 / 743B) TaxID=573061 RepID=D9SUB5_CLOC7|nr:DUF6106 family protein [Clostridium cellulovorans]ADL52870.1 hypothetical protein Clocel_3184 [Clostridium cellulovorans 743B]